jgi:hypothetical protein
MRVLQRVLEMLGTAGVLALGVLLFCLPFYLTAVAPTEREIEAQRAAVVRLESRSPDQPVAGKAGPAADLWRFHSLFPPVERLPDELESLYGLARGANLELQQGEYRMEARGAGLASYRVTLPIRGAYPQIREFVGAILAQAPTVSVDALRFERKKVGDPQIEAQVRVTMHFRPSAEGEPR